MYLVRRTARLRGKVGVRASYPFEDQDSSSERKRTIAGFCSLPLFCVHALVAQRPNSNESNANFGPATPWSSSRVMCPS